MEQHHIDNLSSILLCFGTIEHDRAWGQRVPPETEDQKRAKLLLEMRKAEKAKAELAAKQQKKAQMTAEE